MSFLCIFWQFFRPVRICTGCTQVWRTLMECSWNLDYHTQPALLASLWLADFSFSSNSQMIQCSPSLCTPATHFLQFTQSVSDVKIVRNPIKNLCRSSCCNLLSMRLRVDIFGWDSQRIFFANYSKVGKLFVCKASLIHPSNNDTDCIPS